ncbi:MAG TPA: glucans biosynthesis glucosyltransferase MdoH [Caulobacteraceae bacterium]|jgi:membrane glycosyltransferase|nr:glucans biosynthesis glucosyltransferase MdoH [Caulobacteraceae bacterium]
MLGIVWERLGPDLDKPEDRPQRRRAKGRRDAAAAARAVENLKATTLRMIRAKPVVIKPADAFFHSTPGLAPLDMPVQDLHTAEAAAPTAEPAMAWRRAFVLLGGGALAALAGVIGFQALRAGGITGLEALIIALSVILMAWIGFSFFSAVAGFVLVWRDQRGDAAMSAAPAVATGRTAILMPVYNEDPGRVMSAIEAMGEDLVRLGQADRFDVFILSDTQDGEVGKAEASGFLKLRLRLGDSIAVYYRRRRKNIDRKSGNLADWVRRFGDAYDYMLVLDADSLMSADTMVGLAAGMDRDPKLGLLQTSPTIINAETPFARLQQFACRLYGPMFSRGQDWWSGAEGNYWGHNAIIRVKAFAESAGLPHLSGPKPFGGHILSHDFVEAALLRRRGWAVRMTTTLDGSYEETPPTLLDMAVRDRRWCQGNLQHVRLLGAAGLHWVSRLHLARGVLSYLTPGLWLLLLICGVIVWPHENLRGAARLDVVVLFELSLALLLAPKLMSLFLTLKQKRLRVGFGGASRLVLGVLGEILLWALAAPVLMVMQCVAVVEVLIGRDSGWATQRREGADLSPREAWRAHRGHVALGVLAALAAFLADRYVLMWTSPVLLGLSLSSFLSLHTSRVRGGAGGKRMFLIPEEVNPPPVIERAAELRQRYADQAENRRRIDAMLRAPVPVYDFEKAPVQASTRSEELEAA